MNLSEHFSLDEMIRSQTATRLGIDNSPPDAAVVALRALCEAVLEPLRAHFGPIQISSGYRSPALNRRIGGVATSQHCRGEAADFIVPSESLQVVFEHIRASGLSFDQVIIEGGAWIHVSHRANGPNRRQALVATFRNGRAIYRPA